MRRNQFMVQRAQELRANQNAAEQRVWSILRARRLAGLKFRRQHVLGKYIADFVCIPARLVVEIDGETHGDDSQLSDAKRTEVIERAGYRVIRFWNDYVLNDSDGGVADTILEALRKSALPASEKARLVNEGFVPSPRPSPLRGEGATPGSRGASSSARGGATCAAPWPR